MDLHRTAFKMENSSYMPSPLTSPALMVLASTAEAGRDASVPCQPPRPFGVPVTLEKDMHLPFPSGSYTFASMYHRQGGFPTRDFPTPLLHLHPQFAPPSLDCSPLGMLNHGAVGAFRPFSSPPEERDAGAYQSAFLPAKRLKGCLETEASPHLRYTDVEGKDFDFGGAHVPTGSPNTLKVAEDAGKKLFGLSGLLTEGSSGLEEHKESIRVLLKRNVSLLDRLSTHWETKKTESRGRPGLVSSTLKEHQDSDADLDVDGDDTLEYGKAHLVDDPSLSTLEALKTRIRDLEKQLTRGDRFKCLICMDSYTVPLTSIQCWHVHCEECWLRTLGAKKLCPQCNTITSPGDLRRVYL
ncbi:E3 ubiquitin-protein ligase RNF220-like protein [Labeo rohita]|uniref:E3 ubiquitin-protein ligase RNF220 n=1 Tax=Labeo rohita TaxID=84645 RepID=A0A498NS16_LABRO|nr:E3 ubiquitin-protein ligase RNF220-like protein [Labeo rohita]